MACPYATGAYLKAWLEAFAESEMRSFTLSDICGPQRGGALGERFLYRMLKEPYGWGRESYRAAARLAGHFVLRIATMSVGAANDAQQTVQTWVADQEDLAKWYFGREGSPPS